MLLIVPTNQKNWLTFCGDPVPDKDSGSVVHFPCGIQNSRRFVGIVILEMTLSEPQCSCVVATFRGINSKDEQGNDNIIAAQRHGSSTATENILTIYRPYMTRDAAAIAAAAAAAVP